MPVREQAILEVLADVSEAIKSFRELREEFREMVAGLGLGAEDFDFGETIAAADELRQKLVQVFRDIESELGLVVEGARQLGIQSGATADDTEQLSDDMSRLERDLKQARLALNGLTASTEGVERLDQNFDRLAGRVENLRVQLIPTTQVVEDLETEAAEAETELRDLSEAVDTSQAREEVEELSEYIEDLADTATEAGRKTSESLGDIGDQADRTGRQVRSGLDPIDALSLALPGLGKAVLGLAAAYLTFQASFKSTRAAIDTLKKLGIDVDELVGRVIDFDAAANIWLEALERVGLQSRDTANETQFLTNARRTLINFGEEFVDTEDGIREAYEKLTAKIRENSNELRRSIELLEELRGFSQADVVAEIDELAVVLERQKEELFASTDAMEAYGDKVDEISSQLDALGSTIEDETLDKFNRLKLEYLGLRDSSEAASRAGEELAESITGSAEPLREQTAALIAAIDRLREYNRLTEENVETVKGQIQEQLDGYARLGQQVPASLQRVADEFGVLTTVQQRHADEAEKQAERAAAAEEKAANRRIAALDRMAAAFQRFGQQVSQAQEETGGLPDELAEVEAEIDRLQSQPLFGDQLIQLQELEDKAFELRSTTRDTADSQAQSAAKTQKAIQDLVLSVGEDFSKLNETQRAEIENILGQFEKFAASGVESTQFVTGALERFSEILKDAGGDTKQLDAVLEELEGGALSLSEALEKVREAGEGGLEIDVTDSSQLIDQQIEKLDELEAKTTEVAAAAAEAFQGIKNQADLFNATLTTSIALCVELRDCLESI